MSNTGGGVSTDFAGVWKGYVENYAFDDGTDTVTLTLDSTVAGVSGNVRFGDAPTLPPATDPNAGYPPTVDFGGAGAPGVGGALSGFDFSLLAGSFDGLRLKFQVADDELWGSWCALQTPVYDDGYGTWGCAHNWGYASNGSQCTQTDPKTGQSFVVSCAQISLCTGVGVCACDQQSCSAHLDKGGPNFDMQLKPPNADGSVAGLDGSVHNVHLVKQ